jgi:hypothetical protein
VVVAQVDDSLRILLLVEAVEAVEQETTQMVLRVVPTQVVEAVEQRVGKFIAAGLVVLGL